MQEDSPAGTLSEVPEIYDDVNDCWSLLLTEGGGNRLDNLTQLLSLTSIIEREYTYICASRILNGKSPNSSGGNR